MPSREFFADTPNAENDAPPSDLGLVAEEVAIGLNLSLAALKLGDERAPAPERVRLSLQLDQAVGLFARFIEGSRSVGWQPVLVTAEEPVDGFRLGLLPGNEPALFAPAQVLEPRQAYPVNYIGRHFVPQGFEGRDSLPGSHYGQQWYMGCCAPEIGDLSGYAISVNQFNNLFGNGLSFTAQPPEQSLSV